MDHFILINTALSCILFFCLHIFVFRRTESHKVLTLIVRIFMAVVSLNALLCLVFVFCTGIAAHYGIFGIIVLLAISVALCGIVCFGYVTCVVGPYESSVRLRIVREIFEKGHEGLTDDELQENYGPETLLDIRLQRLKSSGDITQEGDKYYFVERESVFSLLTKSSEFLKRIYKIS